MGLFVAAAFLVADVILENTGQADATIVGRIFSFDTWGLFVLGVATGIVAFAGIHLTAHGLAKSSRRGRERRRLLREVRAKGGPQAGNAVGATDVPTSPMDSSDGRQHTAPLSRRRFVTRARNKRSSREREDAMRPM
jgi:hypothetical protein